MIWALLGALLLAISSPWIRSRIWGVPLRLLSVATLVRASVGGALLELLVASVTAVVLWALRADPAVSGPVAAVTGVAAALTIVVLSARRLALLRGAALLALQMRDPAAREDAARALDRLLDRAKKRAGTDGGDYARAVLLVTNALTQAGHWDRARARLAQLDHGALDPPLRALAGQMLATCHLHFGELAAARATIAQLERPAPPEIEVWLRADEAMLFALAGQPDEALRRVGVEASEDDAVLRASHRVVRAPACAAWCAASITTSARATCISTRTMPRGSRITAASQTAIWRDVSDALR